MTIDLRTPAEIRYDAERDGSLYIKPAALQDNPRADLPLLPEEATILAHLRAGLTSADEKVIAILRVIDGGE